MGTELIDTSMARAHGAPPRCVPWLDPRTNALVIDLVVSLAQRHADLLAIILYGTVARHDECALTDPERSDVDLLMLFSEPIRLPLDRRLAIYQAMLATRDLVEWDPAFVANVARDGCVLFARGPLAPPLAHLAHVANRARNPSMGR